MEYFPDSKCSDGADRAAIVITGLEDAASPPAWLSLENNCGDGHPKGIDYAVGRWQEDTPSCSLCSASIGQWTRHHCRICGLCVCATCSPSSVWFDGAKKLQRVCNACVETITANVTACRLAEISTKMFILSGVQSFFMCSEPFDILDATSRCEAALLPLEAALDDSHQRTEKAEMQVAAVSDSVKRFLQGLQTLPCLTQDVAAHQQPSGMLDITASLDAAHAAIHRELQGCRDSCSRASSFGSFTASTSLGSAGSSLLTGAGSSSLTSARSSSLTSARTESESADEAFQNGKSVERRRCGSKRRRWRVRPIVTESGKEWEEDGARCSICCAKFGWLLFKRRHHCRLCGKCVCSSCSPNSVCPKGKQLPVRVCTYCFVDSPRSRGTLQTQPLKNAACKVHATQDSTSVPEALSYRF